MTDRQYPVGKFEFGKSYTFAETQANCQIIKNFVPRLRALAGKLSEAQWQTSYREGGWTALQVVHHLADSHLNAITRLKLGLTEENPTIRPYEEDRWANLPDYALPAEVSLQLLEAVHTRWATILESLSEQDFQRTFFHPASKYTFTLAESTAHYVWHCEHHLAHIGLVL